MKNKSMENGTLPYHVDHFNRSCFFRNSGFAVLFSAIFQYLDYCIAFVFMLILQAVFVDITV